jgi:RimJ/RimL family protein N-acetyltransferase
MHFDPQPTLTGELLQLRPLTVDDYAALYAVASDPLLWEQHPNSDRYQESVFQELFRGAVACGGALTAIDLSTGKIIGSSRFHGFREPGDGAGNGPVEELEIGWTFLARSHWGGRYNAEMKRLMLEHAFRFVPSVVLVIGPQNLRSRRAAQKVGAVFAGTRSSPDGADKVVYRITAPQ